MNALKRIGIARTGCVLLSCVALIFATGCAARVYSESEPVGAYPVATEDDTVVYVDTVPPDIEAYPHYYYGGGEAYYVDGRWYRRGPRGWGYYRQEPPELGRQRPAMARQAPGEAIRRDRLAERVERAPAAQRERAPDVSRPSRGVVEQQPRSGKAPAHPAPANNRTAPSREHER